MLVEAAAAVCAATLALKFLPFRWVIRLSSKPAREPNAAGPGTTLCDVRWAIDAATRHLPWNPVCIQRGLAGQWMLRRRGLDARLHYGLANGAEGDLKAHVWVEASGENLVGGENAGEYIRVATFP